MPGRTEREAEQAFLDPLIKALSCIARAKFRTFQKNGSKLLFLEGVELKGAWNLTLEVTHYYRLLSNASAPAAERYRVSTLSYYYTFFEELEAPELISYQWHPEGNSDFLGPHLHIGSGAGVPPWLAKCHLPSGRVSFEQIVLLAIEGFGVKPLRADYREVLQASHDRFTRYRTQPGDGFA
jgi:hypothetical protein